MGSSESTGRSNGAKKGEEGQPENSGSGGTPNLGAAAAAIGTAAVVAWGVSKMLSDNKSDKNNWNLVKEEMHGAYKSLGFDGSSSSAPSRRFKMTTDGTCHPNHGGFGGHDGRGPSGYAGILEDYNGNWVRGFRGFIGDSDCLTAEFHAILKGLEVLDKLGYKESVLENDCQAAVQWVTGDDVGPSKSPVIRDCWTLIEKSKHLISKNKIEVHCCSRAESKYADKLAWVAIQKRDKYVEFTDVDSEINQ